MMKSKIASVLGGICLILSGAAVAAPEAPELNVLKTALGGAEPDSVRESPVHGLFEVVVDGRLLYLSADGRFIVSGSVVDLEKGEDVTEPRRAEIRAETVAAVGESNMVIFSPAEGAKHSITVFTDIDCGYCRKLHSEMADYHEQGIEVRYLFFPRTGLDTPSYDKAVSVWCADDKQSAMTMSKNGESIEDRSCPNPVREHFELGGNLGVQGTPAIVTESGKMIPGYVPAERLSEILSSS